MLDQSFDIRDLPSRSMKVSFLHQEGAKVNRITDEVRAFYRGDVLITESDLRGEMHVERTLTFSGEDRDVVNEAYNRFNQAINGR